MNKIAFWFLCSIFLMPCLFPIVSCNSGEIDVANIVTNVIDGDTFDIALGNRVRLADINAPESGQSGYDEAKDFLFDLVYWKTVYLDIDEYANGTYRKDLYGRLICVVYIDYNSSHCENVNKALIANDKAVISDYSNDFDPYSWALYVSRDSIPEFSSLTMLSLLVIVTLVAVTVCKRKHFLC